MPASPLAMKRALFPLRGPRWQTIAWWPVHVACAAIDGYFDAFFAVLTPPGAGSASPLDASIDWDSSQ